MRLRNAIWAVSQEQSTSRANHTTMTTLSRPSGLVVPERSTRLQLPSKMRGQRQGQQCMPTGSLTRCSSTGTKTMLSSSRGSRGERWDSEAR